jgi:hypothetical protein
VVTGQEAVTLLRDALGSARFTASSNAMAFYTLRALSSVGAGLYDSHFHSFWAPWRAQLAQNVTTWVEESVGQRSDCHAWGSAPLYEFIAEVSGLRPLTPGWGSVSFQLRLALFPNLDAKVPVVIKGSDEQGIASVCWSRQAGGKVKLSLSILSKTGSLVDVQILVKLPDWREELVGNPYESEIQLGVLE